MNWVEVITLIYETLRAKGYRDIVYEIGEEHVKGGTPGEMFILIVTKLMSIKNTRPDVYALIKEETEWMIKYAQILNYIR